jgi:hypothetical protein
MSTELNERIDFIFDNYSSPKYNLRCGGMAVTYYFPPVQASIWQEAFGQDWKPEYP